MTVSDALTARQAHRLARSMTGTATVLVRAPREYRPRQLARALVERIDARHLDMPLPAAARDTSWVEDLALTPPSCSTGTESPIPPRLS